MQDRFSPRAARRVAACKPHPGTVIPHRRRIRISSYASEKATTADTADKRVQRLLSERQTRKFTRASTINAAYRAVSIDLFDR